MPGLEKPRQVWVRAAMGDNVLFGLFSSSNGCHLGALGTSQAAWMLSEGDSLSPLQSWGRLILLEIRGEEPGGLPHQLAPHTWAAAYNTRMTVGTCGCGSKGTTCMWVCSLLL